MMINDHKVLSKYLRQRGYIVYPDELKCGYIDTPNYPHRWVDVVAYKKKKWNDYNINVVAIRIVVE